MSKGSTQTANPPYPDLKFLGGNFFFTSGGAGFMGATELKEKPKCPECGMSMICAECSVKSVYCHKCGNLIKQPSLHNWCCPVCFNELRRPK